MLHDELRLLQLRLRLRGLLADELLRLRVPVLDFRPEEEDDDDLRLAAGLRLAAAVFLTGMFLL